jgi:hypothetical protein
MRKFLIRIELLLVRAELALLAARRHWALLLMALVLAGLAFLLLAK